MARVSSRCVRILRTGILGVSGFSVRILRTGVSGFCVRETGFPYGFCVREIAERSTVPAGEVHARRLALVPFVGEPEFCRRASAGTKRGAPNFNDESEVLQFATPAADRPFVCSQFLGRDSHRKKNCLLRFAAVAFLKCEKESAGAW